MGGGDYFSTYPATSNASLDVRVQAAIATQPVLFPIGSLDIDALRAQYDKVMTVLPGLNESVARVEDRKIPGPHGEIPIRIYTPEGEGPFPVLLYLHGGGWMLGSVHVYDDFCRSLSHRTGAVVVSVGYRLVPEYRFPVPLEDCVAALAWTAAHASEIEGDARRIAVAGDSAGGNLSAALALYARDHGGPKLSYQILMFPATNAAFDTASYYENAVGYGLTRVQMQWCWERYLAEPSDGDNPYAAPLKARDLKGLPPALIITAQFDVLRDDGEAYAARLYQAGVPVRAIRYLDMSHDFIVGLTLLPQARHALDQIATTLKDAWK